MSESTRPGPSETVYDDDGRILDGAGRPIACQVCRGIDDVYPSLGMNVCHGCYDTATIELQGDPGTEPSREIARPSEIIAAAEVIRPESITRPVTSLSIEADGITGLDVRQEWTIHDGPGDVVIEVSPFDPYADSDDDEEEQGAYVHGTEIRVRGNTDRLALTLALRQLADTLDPRGPQSPASSEIEMHS